jgi:hypothetical protein
VEDLHSWFTSTIHFATGAFRKESGLQSLTIYPVWIGNGCGAACWVLFPGMKNKQKEALDAFKKIIGVVDDPIAFYPYQFPEPCHLRNLGPLSKDIKEMLLEMFCEHLEAGEPLMDDYTLLEQDMAKLTVEAN